MGTRDRTGELNTAGASDPGVVVVEKVGLCSRSADIFLPETAARERERRRRCCCDDWRETQRKCIVSGGSALRSCVILKIYVGSPTLEKARTAASWWTKLTLAHRAARRDRRFKSIVKLTVQMKVLLGLCLLSVISMMVATSTFETGMGDGAQLLRAEAQNARAMKAAVRSHVGENPLVATRGVRDASASVDAEFAASHFCQEDTRALRRALGLDPASRGAGLLGAGRPHPHLAHELAAHIARLALLRVGAGARWGVGAPRAEGRSPARRLVHAPRASVLGALLLLLHLEEQLVVRGALLSLRLAQVRACGGGSACAGGGACARARCARQARLQPRGARERCIGRREWVVSARAGRDARDEERARPPPPSRRGESPPPAVAGRATKLSRARAAPSTASQLVAAGPAVEGRGRAARAEGRTAPALRPPPSAPTKAEAPSWRRRGPALVGRARGRRLLPPRLARTAVTLAPAAADTDPPAPPPGLASLRRRDGALRGRTTRIFFRRDHAAGGSGVAGRSSSSAAAASAPSVDEAAISSATSSSHSSKLGTGLYPRTPRSLPASSAAPRSNSGASQDHDSQSRRSAASPSCAISGAASSSAAMAPLSVRPRAGE